MTDEIQREQMDVDVLIVGGGAAGMSAALRLSLAIEDHNNQVASGRKQGSPIPEQMIVVVEKASEIGGHSVSGAVLNPVALRELIPDFKDKGCPIESEVKEDAVYYLSEKSAFKLPITPPNFKNHGNFLITLSKFNKWLGQQCEARGINIFPGFAAAEVIYDGNKVVGVRTGDKGLDKNGKPKSNFEPGLILKSKLVIFAEGTRGSLFRQHAKKHNLWDGKNFEVFEEGVKEIVQMPPGTVKPGTVIHTAGFPLKKSVGGTFIYTLPGDRISIGLVAYLDTNDPLLDPHRELQKLKTHPFVRDLLKGGKVTAYGGKTLPAGGWYSMPKLYGDGWMVCGDTAGMVDVKKLKGIHMAMKSGMLAAESAVQCILAQDFSEKSTKAYETAVHASFIKKELYAIRNFQQTMAKGLLAAVPLVGLQEITGGAGILGNMKNHEDAKTTHPVGEIWGNEGLNAEANQLPKPDGVLFFDKLSSVYLTGTSHDEDSPNHLKLGNPDTCRSNCEPKFKSPCVRFCPASVYEMIPARDGAASKYDLQINFTNCIHCKTCDIKCPFENIEWTVPEGGGGPKYQET